MPKNRRLRYDPNNDLYVTLGISAGATDDELQHAYRQRAKEVHPDVNPNNVEWANEQIRHLNEAYDVLSNPTLRSEYDQLRYPYQPISIGTKQRPVEPSRRPTRTSRSSSASRSVWMAKGYVRPQLSETSAYLQNVMRRLLGGPYRRLLALLVMALVVNVFFILTFAPLVNFASRSTQITFFRPAVPSVISLLTPDCTRSNVTITQPSNGNIIDDAALEIRGTATDTNFRDYMLEVDPDNATSGHWALPEFASPVEGANRPLASKVSFKDIPPGMYILRLTVFLQDGSVLTPCEVHFSR